MPLTCRASGRRATTLVGSCVKGSSVAHAPRSSMATAARTPSTHTSVLYAWIIVTAPRPARRKQELAKTKAPHAERRGRHPSSECGRSVVRRSWVVVIWRRLKLVFLTRLSLRASSLFMLLHRTIVVVEPLAEANLWLDECAGLRNGFQHLQRGRRAQQTE